jgi:hypothetical protein
MLTSTNSMFDVTDKRPSLMRFVSCLVLGLYSFALISYTLSEFVSGEAACTHCFKGEAAFAGGTGPNGEASTPLNRYVNVGFAAAGPNSFPATAASKISNAINTAAAAWNNAVAEDGTSKTPYNVQQTTNGNKVNVIITLVDRIPGKTPGAPDACGGIYVPPDANGNITEAQILIPKNIFNNLTQDEVAKIVEHELGHFFGLENIGDSSTGKCDSIMDKANDATCKVKNNISKGDISTVIKHVNENNKCDRKRKGGLNPLGGVGPVEPPIPYYYPTICYYLILEVPHYSEGSYLYSDYYLEDIFCI